MSTLLDQSSLVMIPSGYKEDVVYSVIPETGAGDLSFTRASNGTRVNSAGLVEVVAWNLCEYSEDQTQWTIQNETTVTANSTTAPNGTTTADTVTPTAVYDDHYRGIGLSSQVGELTAFIYVKPNGYNFFDWGIWNGSHYLVRATFDLVNLTYTFTIAGTATIESVGNGWLKCGISGTNASLSSIQLYHRIRPTGGAGSFTGNGTSGAFLWGAQLNIGSTAKPYFPTTDRLDVPRLTYQNGGGGCPSLLLEPQRTNLVSYSEQFDNAAWNKTTYPITITANQTTSPSGYLDADLLTPTAASSRHAVGQTTIAATSGVVYTISAFFKKGGSQYVVLTDAGDTAWHIVTADLDSGTITNQTNATGTITDYGNGWYRVTCTFTRSVTSNIFVYLGASSVSNATSLPTFNNVTLTTYAWGVQVEAGSYATSYIPTTSSSATRVEDTCFKTGISSLIGQTEGVIFADITPQIFNDSAYQTVAIIYPSAGLGGTYVHFYKNLGTKTLFFEVWNATSQCGLSYTMANNTRYKVAAVYKNNDFALYVNGVQVGSDTSGTVASVTYSTLEIGYDSFNANPQMSLSEFVLFPTRLTNSEIAQLTGNQNYTINQAYASYGVASESSNCVQP